VSSTANALFFLRDSLVCSKPLRNGTAYNGTVTSPLPSVAYCCPECGSIWGRVMIHKQGSLWDFQRRYCEHHARPNHPDDGIFFSSHLDYLLEGFPEEVLRHDFLQLLKGRDFE
jgi:hypothetical protein